MARVNTVRDAADMDCLALSGRPTRLGCLYIFFFMPVSEFSPWRGAVAAVTLEAPIAVVAATVYQAKAKGLFSSRFPVSLPRSLSSEFTAPLLPPSSKRPPSPRLVWSRELIYRP